MGNRPPRDVSRHAACAEALTPPPVRAQLIAAASEATVTTRQFDIAAGYRWPAMIPEWVLVDSEGRPAPVNAGQGVGLVTVSQPVAAVIDRLCGQVSELLSRWSWAAPHTIFCVGSVKRGRGRPTGPGVDSGKRRSELLDAAERAIRRHGPDVGLAEVARNAGFGRSAVYAVFPNRAAMVSALSERQAQRLMAEITKRAAGSTDLRQRMSLFFDVICQWTQEEPNLYRALNVSGSHEMTSVFDKLAEAVEAMLAASLATNGADVAAAGPWARAIVGSATVTAQWWRRSSTMPRAELVAHLTALCWEGGAAMPFSPFDVAAIDSRRS